MQSRCLLICLYQAPVIDVGLEPAIDISMPSSSFKRVTHLSDDKETLPEDDQPGPSIARADSEQTRWAMITNIIYLYYVHL